MANRILIRAPALPSVQTPDAAGLTALANNLPVCVVHVKKWRGTF